MCEASRSFAGWHYLPPEITGTNSLSVQILRCDIDAVVEGQVSVLGRHLFRHLGKDIHFVYSPFCYRADDLSAEKRKHKKYECVSNAYLFVPFAVETLGPFGEEALALVKDLGKRLIKITGEPRSCAYLIQRISIAIQRGVAASILASVSSIYKNIFIVSHTILCGSLNK
jgi:hypothetical protein